MKMLRALVILVITALIACAPAMAAGPDPVPGGPDAPLGGPDAPPPVAPSAPPARPDPPVVQQPLGPPTPPPPSTPSRPSSPVFTPDRPATPTLTPAQVAAQQRAALAARRAQALAQARADEARQRAAAAAAAAAADRIVQQSKPGLAAATGELRRVTQRVADSTSDLRRDLLLSDGGSSGRTTLYMVLGLMLCCMVVAWFGRGLWTASASVSGRAAAWSRTSQLGAIMVLAFVWLALIWRLTLQG
jgi:hypothetical protein